MSEIKINELVEKYRESILEGYSDRISGSDRLESDYRREKSVSDDYKGRELLELIQNCIDAMPENGNENVIKISMNEGLLSISNSGKPFTYEGVKSLMIANLSSKMNDDNNIGAKGLGFRSLINWAKEIRIYSEDLSIGFSRNFANGFYKKNGIHSESAMLTVPEIIENKETGYTTTIEIDCKDISKEDIIKQMLEVNDKTLLFLPKVETLITCIDGKESQITKKMTSKTNHEIVSITKDDIQVEKWKVFSKNGSVQYRDEVDELNVFNYKISLAYNGNSQLEIHDNVFYSYFATDIDNPLNVLINAKMILTENRNSIVKNDINKTILKEIIVFIKETSELLADYNNPWQAFRTIYTREQFSSVLSYEEFDFDKEYREMLSKVELLPTIKPNIYRSAITNPKFYNSQLGEYLKEFPDAFSELLLPDKTSEFVYFLATYIEEPRYSLEEISEKVSFLIKGNRLNLDQRVDFALVFHEEYKIHKAFRTITPTFFVDNNNESIANGDIYFTSSEDIISDPPKFVHPRILSKEQLKMLTIKLKAHSRELRNMPVIRAYGIDEYSFSAINNTITGAIKHESDDQLKKEKVVSAVQWLLKNQEFISSGPRYEFFLLNKENEVILSDKLYLGQDYGVSRFDGVLAESKFVAHFNTFGIKEDNKSEFTSLLKQIGVSDFWKRVTIERSLDSNYLEYVKDKLNYPVQHYEFGSISNPGELRKYLTGFKIPQVSYIENFDEILKSGMTSDIVKILSENDWILSENDERSFLKVTWGNKVNDREILDQRIFPYLRYKLMNTKWINIDGTKYAPSELILYRPLKTIPREVFNNLIGIEEKDTSISTEILQKLFVKRDFVNVPTETINKLLAVLPDYDSDGKISKKLYLDVLDSKRKIEISRVSDVKVWCKQRCFRNADEVSYADKAISSVLEREINLIDIPRRQNSKKISSWLGILKVDSDNFKVCEQKSEKKLTEVFQRSLDKLKYFVLAKRNKDISPSELAKLKRLRITLSKTITVTDGTDYLELKDYDFALGIDGWSLKIPITSDSIESLLARPRYQEAIANIILTEIDIPDNEALSEQIKRLTGYLLSTEDFEVVLMEIIEDEEIISEAKRLLELKIDKEVRIEDWTERNVKKIENAKNILESSYVNNLWMGLKQATLEEQKAFLARIDVYKNYELQSIPNKRHFNAEKLLRKEFNIFKTDKMNFSAFKQEKEANKQELSRLFSNNIEELLLFLDKRPNNSLIFFSSNLSYLSEGFQKELIKSQKEELDRREIAETNSSENVRNIEIAGNIREIKNGKKNNSHAGFRGRGDSTNTIADKKKIGDKGEIFALKKLRERNRNNQVIGVSATFEDEFGFFDDSLGYDVKVLKEIEGEVDYYEVKSVAKAFSGTIEFHLSHNEVEFAKKNDKNYYIFFVWAGDYSFHIIKFTDLADNDISPKSVNYTYEIGIE